MCKTVNQRLMENPNFKNGLEVLFTSKPKKKVFRKAAEELLELSVNILKNLNSPGKITDEDFAEEIVDVAMHIELLQKYFDTPLLKGLVAGKVNKMITSKDFKKYVDKYLKSESVSDRENT